MAAVGWHASDIPAYPRHDRIPLYVVERDRTRAEHSSLGYVGPDYQLLTRRPQRGDRIVDSVEVESVIDPQGSRTLYVHRFGWELAPAPGLSDAGDVRGLICEALDSRGYVACRWREVPGAVEDLSIAVSP